MTDVREFNRDAWDRRVAAGNRWTVAVSSEQVAAARRGEWSVLLTPTRPVPREWFPPLAGAKVLGLASGGGQQGPLLAAAGAVVTVLDGSPRQLQQDREVARRDGLELTTVEGDMRDLSRFETGVFDLVFFPVAHVFVPDVRPVWREAARVLRPGGVLLAGLANPLLYALGDADDGEDPLRLTHELPYSDLARRTPAELERFAAEGRALEFGHTLEDLIGGQLEAGLELTGFYEDRWQPSAHPAERWVATFFATRAVRRSP